MNIQFFVRRQFLRLQCRRYTASVCGHLTKRSGLIGTEKDSIAILTLPLGPDGRPCYCIDCINGMSIRCGWCGGEILIGDPVTLTAPANDYNVVGAWHVENGRESIIGCLSWGCGESMAMSGHWQPPGKVRRTPSPLEVCLATGKSVYMSDVSSGVVHVIEDDKGAT